MRVRVRATVVASGVVLALTGLVGWWMQDGTTEPPAFGGDRARALATTTIPTGTPSGGTSTAPAPPSTRAVAPERVPVRELRLPAYDVRVPVVAVGVARDGTMEIPENVATAGWYRFGPAPGDRRGSAVLSGHINDGDQGIGAFAVLGEMTAGDPVLVTLADGRVLRYRVVARERFDKGVVPMARIFDRGGAPRLTLVTCGGAFDRSSGNYRDNVVVTAVPSGPD